VTETPAILDCWLGDGSLIRFEPRKEARDMRLSLGRTNSKRALGFLVKRSDANIASFVLDREQVVELAAYLQCTLPRLLKPTGRKRDQLSLAAMLKYGKRTKSRRRQKRGAA